MVKMNDREVQIHVLTGFNHNLNLIHYLSHNFQRYLGKLKVKVWTGHRNGINVISNKTVSDKPVALLCYLLKYKLLFSVLHLIYLFSYHFSLRCREPNAGISLK